MFNLWSIGFRPFFLIGSAYSMLVIFYWAWVFYTGNLPSGYFDPINWHAHEMIFGFATSIVAGFLLTASPNWTQSPHLSGKKLTLLFGAWFAGRIAFTLSLFELPIPHWIYAAVDLLFIPMLVAALAPALIRARALRNLQFLPVLGLLAIGNLMTHLAGLELIAYEYGSKALYLAVNLIILIVVIIGGRIVPAFTGNALRVETKKWSAVEKGALASVWAYILIDYLMFESPVTGLIALIAGLLNLIRLAGWRTKETLKVPLLWILHLGYLWIVAGFLLIFMSDTLALLPRSVAIHAFTAGSMGTFIIGMMSRVSLGHSGRPLKLAPRFVWAYVLITLSGVIRVLSGFVPDYYQDGILVAGISWGLSFLIFIFYYLPILISPRADGRPG